MKSSANFACLASQQLGLGKHFLKHIEGDTSLDGKCLVAESIMPETVWQHSGSSQALICDRGKFGTSHPPINAPATVNNPFGKSSSWLIAIVVVVATVMEVLDTTIANAALRYIANSLAISIDGDRG